jgi:hypothetical protein
MSKMASSDLHLAKSIIILTNHMIKFRFGTLRNAREVEYVVPTHRSIVRCEVHATGNSTNTDLPANNADET